MRVIVIKEENMFVGQCLEHDICAQGSTVPELMERLSLTASLEADDRGGSLEGLEPAPDHFHQMWDSALRFAEQQNGYEMALAA